MGFQNTLGLATLEQGLLFRTQFCLEYERNSLVKRRLDVIKDQV